MIQELRYLSYEERIKEYCLATLDTTTLREYLQLFDNVNNLADERGCVTELCLCVVITVF